MFDNVRDKITILIIKQKLRKRHIAKQNFRDVFIKSESFFLILPEDEIDYHSINNVVKFLEDNNKKFIIFTNDFRISPLPAKLKSNAIDFGVKDITVFGMPSKKISNKLSEITVDVVIDLNRKRNLFYSYVSNLVNSNIRIGFEKDYSDMFYNLQFANSQENPEIIYNEFLNSLQMF